MSIRYPVMVFSFENVPARKGVFIGAVSLEDRELALPNLRVCVEQTFARACEEHGCTGNSQGLYADVYAKLAWAYLEQFSSETPDGQSESVTLSSHTPWSLQVRVVNSDEAYWTHLSRVCVNIFDAASRDNETPEMRLETYASMAEWAGISVDEVIRLVGPGTAQAGLDTEETLTFIKGSLHGRNRGGNPD